MMSIFGKHRHAYRRTAIKHMRRTFPTSGGDITMILLTCPCGQAKTETIDGHWTLEELGMAPADTYTKETTTDE